MTREILTVDLGMESKELSKEFNCQELVSKFGCAHNSHRFLA
jgi:hypothetical protein